MDLIHTQTQSGKGRRPEQFRERLTGIAVDAVDRLWAVGDQEVKRFSVDGALEHRFPTRSPGWSIAVDGESLWLGMQGTIDRFDFQGKLQGSIKDKQHLGIVTGLAVKGDMLLAADATNRTIHRYEDGAWQREVGGEVNTRGFMIPNGVLDLALDVRNQAFVVAHPQKHRVERYDLAGKLMDKFGRFGMQDPADFGGCCNPTNITATAEGVIAVSEKAPPRVKVFTSDGKFVAQSADGLFDANTKNVDLAADGRGRLYATDPLRCTIVVFDLGALAD